MRLPWRKRAQLEIKYALDRLCAAGLLVPLSPLLGLIALGIKLDDGGDVFFRSDRVGWRGRVFRIWKFRTMIPDADKYLQADGMAAENRITRIGKHLRTTSLDELPQIINILGGEMSFIGPRPPLPEHVLRYREDQKGRFAVKPGITGLAQVRGRNFLLWSKRIEYDLEYVERYSLLLDLAILLKTAKVVLFREGISLDRNAAQVDDLGRPAEGD